MPAPIDRPTGTEFLPSPEKTTKTLLALIILAATFLDFWSYSRQYYSDPGVYRDVLQGTAAAPNQYRVGVLRLADFIAHHGHMGLRHGMTLVDLLSGILAVFLLYSLLRRSASYQAAGNATRWFGSAAFVVLVQFYLAWLIWYQRPETLPSAALVAFALSLLTPRILPTWAIFAGLLLFSVAQGFVRADVAVAFNLGTLLICLTPLVRDLSLPRWTMTSASTLGLIASAGIQYYLMHIAYPGASYGSTPVIQILLNMTDHLRIFPFLIFMLPWVWTLQHLVRRRVMPTGPSAALVAGSTVFLLLWCIFGKVDEVRIFLPFALALAPLTAEIAIQQTSKNV